MASAVGLLRHRTALFLLMAAAAWGSSEGWLRWTARGRIDVALEQSLARPSLVNVAVTLGFAPEDFHIRLFQGYGVVSGVKGATVFINRVRPEDVGRIARHYWVRRITLQ